MANSIFPATSNPVTNAQQVNNNPNVQANPQVAQQNQSQPTSISASPITIPIQIQPQIANTASVQNTNNSQANIQNLQTNNQNISSAPTPQTYNPDNFSIICAQKQDYEMFYNTEIALREQLKYPPFCDIILIGFNSLSEKEIMDASIKIYNYLKTNLNGKEYNVLKPMPSPIDKIQNRYRWRIIIKGNMTEAANNVLNTCLRKFYNSNYKNTRVSVDVNPNNMI